MNELVRLTVVGNEPEAAMVCGLLGASGIQSMARITDIAFGQGGEMPLSGGGPREILVRRGDLGPARELLAVQVTRGDLEAADPT